VVTLLKELGKRLLALRTEAGLTQDELGDKVGVTGKSINVYETGRGAPSYHVLIRLADYFGVTLDYLCGRSNSRHGYSPGISESEWPDGAKVFYWCHQKLSPEEKDKFIRIMKIIMGDDVKEFFRETNGGGGK
jgi:transcriptional regulator with XRE-family HTH domain